jgi:uncharacterized protein involved in type VI secretion and phage assembly
MRESAERYFGKYRGTVVNNVDPLQIGRIQALVPDVSDQPLSWAVPCVPWAGSQAGMFAVPQVGSPVWIEFERGDADAPIWTGGYWSSAAEVPTFAAATPPGLGLTIQTAVGNGLVVNDMPGPVGGIILQSRSGATLIVSDQGIIIQNGTGASITMIGPTVNLNAGAMVIQ